MNPATPPRWLEGPLLLLLPRDDREPIAGDLLEAYREDQLPRLGVWRANLWYFRRLLGIISIRLTGGRTVRMALIFASAFASLAGAWLAVMENLLRHDGYGTRTVVALFIAVQGLATLLFMLRSARRFWIATLSPGAAGVTMIGAIAIWRILHSSHFEGFVLIIGAVLIVQGALTMAMLFRRRAMMLKTSG